MSFRIPLSSFKCLCSRQSTYMLHLNFLLMSKSQISFASITNPLASEILQFPKHVQPLVNQSVEEVLSVINSKPITSNESVSILKVLRMFTLFKNVDSDSFKENKKFKILCETFERNCNVMHPNLLVSGLRSLLEVGMPSNSTCVISAEQSILNNINLFSAFNIIGCLYYHHKFMETDLQKEVVSILASVLCRRISEIKSNAEVLMLVHFLHIFKGDDRKNVQQKIIELIPTLNVHEMCKIFITLAENSDRNISILNALSFHLRQKEELLQVKEILDIFYSCKKLNFFDINLKSNLLTKVVSEIPSVSQPSTISGILTICGHLRMRHIGVINLCANWIINHIESCRPKELVSFVLATATLNYSSPEVQKVLQIILPLLSYEKIKDSNVWLDVVWSLAVLNIVDKDMLLQIFSEDFYKPLIDSSDFETASNKMKLMNLKAVLKCHYPECVFRCNLYLDPVEVSQSSRIQNSRQHVLNVLSNFIPKDKYLSTNQNTEIGIFIDAEFIMSKNMKPLLLSEFGILSKVSGVKPVPKGAQRIALLILFFKDFTQYSASKVGFIDFAIRILFAEGYTPVLVPLDEFMRYNTEIKKAKYLLQKISSSMKKVEDNDYKYNAKMFN